MERFRAALKLFWTYSRVALYCCRAARRQKSGDVIQRDHCLRSAARPLATLVARDLGLSALETRALEDREDEIFFVMQKMISAESPGEFREAERLSERLSRVVRE